LSLFHSGKSLFFFCFLVGLFHHSFSRPSLAKYHNQMLTLHGPTGSSPGKWTLSRVGTAEERMSVHNEIRALEEKLKGVDGWETRVKELHELLSVQEGVGEEREKEK